MNIEKIKSIVNSGKPDEIKRRLIIDTLAESTDVVTDILLIIGAERKLNNDLVRELNVEVSRYHIHINNHELLKRNKQFFNNETKSLYDRWAGRIGPCFNNFD